MFVGKIILHSGTLERAYGNLSITGTGTVRIETTETVMKIDNVLFIPELNGNLFSLIKLERKGVRYIYKDGIRSLDLKSQVL